MLLLDTHVVLWVLDDSRRLGEQARAGLSTTAAYVSVASILEMTLKSMLGKMRMPDAFDRRLDDLGFASLAIFASHAAALPRFPELMRHDPFDRLLVAQAAVEGLRLVTADRVLLAGGYPFVVDASV